MHCAQQVVPPQQNSVSLQVFVPQHFFFGVRQNGTPFPGQQNSWGSGLHLLLPQHCLGAVAQKGLLSPGQQVLLLAQGGLQTANCARAGFTPSAATMPPASNPPRRNNAFRRGISLARMRAAWSKK